MSASASASASASGSGSGSGAGASLPTPHRREPIALPDLIAVQSESFFDPRMLVPAIRSEVLTEFDALRSQAMLAGSLSVPAWGANTVRTEFAFLSGIEPGQLGVQRFNPYRAVAAGRNMASLASWLRDRGYRTICVHPYAGSFYHRDRVCSRLGFDEFHDIRSFGDAAHAGPYVSDAAVADKIADILRESAGPVFILAITMENHGPLHLEKLAPGEAEMLCKTVLPPGCEDLAIYLRHLRNADRMAGQLRDFLNEWRPASLCWYGDHVPIMPAVYQAFGRPSGDVPYLCWHNAHDGPPRIEPLKAEKLSIRWLRELGLVVQPEAPARAAREPLPVTPASVPIPVQASRAELLRHGQIRV